MSPEAREVRAWIEKADRDRRIVQFTLNQHSS